MDCKSKTRDVADSTWNLKGKTKGRVRPGRGHERPEGE